MDVVYYVAMSLDGFIGPEDGSIEWLERFDAPGEDFGYGRFIETIDWIVTGRRTYEIAASAADWPYPNQRTVVFSRHGLPDAHPSVERANGDPHEVVDELERRGARRVWLLGGSQLAGSFQAAGLVTTWTLTIMPIALGAGIPLFDPPPDQTNLVLEGVERYASGVVQLTYRVDGRTDRPIG